VPAWVRTSFRNGILPRVGRVLARAVAPLSVFALSACAPAPLSVSPLASAPVCPIEGCNGGDGWVAPSAGASSALCSSDGDAPCAGAPAQECTERALSAWSDARDERALACVARRLSEACSLDDTRACAFAGRLWLDGRGVSRDVRRGLDMLQEACDGGVALACVVMARWLAVGDSDHDVENAQPLLARVEAERTCLSGQGDACFQVGVLFYYGRDAFPRDRAKASRSFTRGCDLGDARACNNLGDALAYGDGVVRNVESAAAAFLKACRFGEALGCANLGYMAEHGEGVARDAPRARTLYRQACAAGDIYGCLHMELLVAQDAGAPRDPVSALDHWSRACEHGRNARACAFVGVMYEDGPDGMARDEAKSLQAMARACDLGENRACEWVKSHSDDD
jgi:TPR repeat protein